MLFRTLVRWLQGPTVYIRANPALNDILTSYMYLIRHQTGIHLYMQCFYFCQYIGSVTPTSYYVHPKNHDIYWIKVSRLDFHSKYASKIIALHPLQPWKQGACTDMNTTHGSEPGHEHQQNVGFKRWSIAQ